MKVIIAGTRTFQDYDLLYQSILALKIPITEIVSGTARGADKLGEQFASLEGIALKKFPAEWDKYGKSAGYRRNEQMAEYADQAIVFWDGQSRGSMHMINIMNKAGKPCHVINYGEKKDG